MHTVDQPDTERIKPGEPAPAKLPIGRWVRRLRLPGAAGPRAVVRRLARRLRAMPAVPAWLLLATIAVSAPLDSLYPATGLDPSWQAALTIARSHRLRFGPELIFTYGPWGFLDQPQAESRVSLLAGMLFAIGAAAAAWLASYAALRAVLSQWLAAVAAALLVSLCALTIVPSALLWAAALLTLLRYVDRQSGRAGGWVPAATAGCAALLLQVKFSEGVVLALAALCAAVFAPARRWRRLAEAALALVAGTLLLWLLVGQSLSDLPAWLREMRQIAGGYTEAMSLEARPNVLPYLLIAAIDAVVVGYLIRLGRTRPARITAGVAVLAALALYLGFREGTGRHGPGMQIFDYLYCLPVLLWGISAARRSAFRIGVGCVTVLLISGTLAPLSPADAVDRWGRQLQLLTDPGYRAQQLQQARLTAQRHYALSAEMRAAVTGPPVAVDPWETTLVWAYDLNWRPAPAFQGYVAYTAQLDALDAASITDAPADQEILRATGTHSIDGRNRLWDPPRYLLTELCRYRPVLTDSRWMLLRKGADRCGSSQQLATQRVTAGQQISVPVAAADSLVTMSFVPDQPGLAVRLGRLLDKSFHPLVVAADGTGFRLPRALADGPLVVNLPLSTGWPVAYGGGTDYRTVRFSEPGQVQFSTILLS
ncbi:MAG: hypothetical protein ACJ74U_15900 [Jatrophihabitantaceae bacterium]